MAIKSSLLFVALPDEAQRTDFAVAELALETAPDEAILDRLAAILWGLP
jgi:two-component system heavy metal sensor histidine kinase CusS